MKKRGKKIRHNVAVQPLGVKSTKYELSARAALLAIERGAHNEQHLVDLYVLAEIASKLSAERHIQTHAASVRNLIEQAHQSGRMARLEYAALEPSKCAAGMLPRGEEHGHREGLHGGSKEMVSKYRAKRTNGYASKSEAKRAEELRLMERAGRITELREQVPYVLAPSVVIQGRKRPPLRYFADFVYVENGKTITEDVKGRITEGYRIKRHLMKSVHGIDIKET